ncbi:unnamed protein product [Notodromas monacha]|uniref:Sulfide:quinone oxidoreductase, mitochondrial n=1 Tax=Notodromas monacha TaxID=399045 RepID=A0A7R9BH55_9CRUS|nr:unnamed protein product [Notodromas monacha]CAG0915388.1 unnamed protein product [Notodromas monacha]
MSSKSFVLLRKLLKVHSISSCRLFSSSAVYRASKRHYDLLVVGGGAGGMSVAATKFKGISSVGLMDGAQKHYYQPLWTLVGAGVKEFAETERRMKDIIPPGVDWIPDAAETFDPEKCIVKTAKGAAIGYKYLVIATGMQLDYNKVDGLVNALENSPKVCSNYSPVYVHKTFPCIENFKEGNAIFTFPNSPVKCAGAPQKIMYLTEWQFKKMGKREKASFKFFSPLPVIFACKKYAQTLDKICADRNLRCYFKRNLIKVDSDKNMATFQNIDDPKDVKSHEYEMLHVSPPMGPVNVMMNAGTLVNKAGFLTVNKETLQHTRYPNIFGIGDCTDVPTSKTAAAAAAQAGHLRKNLSAMIEGKPLGSLYDGYTSCPLTTGYEEVVMAEFDFELQPKETFPFDQSVPRKSMYLIKKDWLPKIYWDKMLKNGSFSPVYPNPWSADQRRFAEILRIMESEGFDFKWEDHSKEVFASIRKIRSDHAFADVTLHSGGRNFVAHKVLLAASSRFFEDLLAGLPANKCNVLVLTDVRPEILRALLDFIYEGESSVGNNLLEDFLTAAKKLQIRGLHSFDARKSRKRKTSGHLRGSTQENDDDEVVSPGRETAENTPVNSTNASESNKPKSMVLGPSVSPTTEEIDTESCVQVKVETGEGKEFDDASAEWVEEETCADGEYCEEGNEQEEYIVDLENSDMKIPPEVSRKFVSSVPRTMPSICRESNFDISVPSHHSTCAEFYLSFRTVLNTVMEGLPFIEGRSSSGEDVLPRL